MDPNRDEPRWKFTASDVMRMVEAGILGDDDRVELIEGELLPMSPQDPPHASVIGRLNSRLVAAFGAGFQVRVQLPLAISERNLPEPDFAVVRGDDRAFETRHPAGADTALVLEVSWSSTRRDRRKAEIYGKGGVPVYWRLDVESRRLETYAEPAADGTYTLVRVHDEHATVDVPGTSARWSVAEMLPIAAG